MRYDKGRKDASRSRIMEVAAERFRDEGIAASGLAAIMGAAGLTNGAFYPHFQSKAELVRESLGAAMDNQSRQIQDVLQAGGPRAAIDAYLSKAHRDNPGKGCASAALLPELARQPPETRAFYTERFMSLVEQVAAALPSAGDPEKAALGVFATLFGSLQLARAVGDPELSDRILEAGKDAALRLIDPEQKRS